VAKNDIIIPANSSTYISFKIKSTSPCVLFSQSVVENYNPGVISGEGKLEYITGKSQGHYIQLPLKNISPRDVILNPISDLYLFRFHHDEKLLIPNKDLVIM